MALRPQLQATQLKFWQSTVRRAAAIECAMDSVSEATIEIDRSFDAVNDIIESCDDK